MLFIYFELKLNLTKVFQIFLFIPVQQMKVGACIFFFFFFFFLKCIPTLLESALAHIINLSPDRTAEFGPADRDAD